jgi:hypothetical protein
MTEQAAPEWDASYTADAPAPWDIGRPQPAFARLADQAPLTGRLLDAGCGTGENALLAASRGADVTASAQTSCARRSATAGPSSRLPPTPSRSARWTARRRSRPG